MKSQMSQKKKKSFKKQNKKIKFVNCGKANGKTGLYSKKMSSDPHNEC